MMAKWNTDRFLAGGGYVPNEAQNWIEHQMTTNVLDANVKNGSDNRSVYQSESQGQRNYGSYRSDYNDNQWAQWSWHNGSAILSNGHQMTTNPLDANVKNGSEYRSVYQSESQGQWNYGSYRSDYNNNQWAKWSCNQFPFGDNASEIRQWNFSGNQLAGNAHGSHNGTEHWNVNQFLPQHQWNPTWNFNGDDYGNQSENVLQAPRSEENHLVENVLQAPRSEENHLVNYLHYLYEKPVSPQPAVVVDSDEGTNNERGQLDVNDSERGVGVMHEPLNQLDVNNPDDTIDVESIEKKAKPASRKLLPKKSTQSNPFQSTTRPEEQRGCDISDMYVESADAGVKKQCCPFCGQLNSQLPRHMKDIHDSEPAVQKFLSQKKGSAERKAILDDLRKTGNYNHNRIADLNKKLYIPSRRPNVNHKREAYEHVFCPYCKGSYTEKGLRLHVKYRCTKKPKVDNAKIKDGRVERGVTRFLATGVEGRIHESASVKLKDLFQMKKRPDNVVRLILFDWLLILYGNKLCKMYNRLSLKSMNRTRLRLAGRILIALKNLQPEITDFASLYVPKFYDDVVQAIRIEAKHNEELEEFDSPGCASKCITGIREIGAILRAKYIKQGDREKQRITEDFMTVFNTEINSDIAKAISETQLRRKIEKQVILPSLDDVTLLARHVDEKRNELFDTLSKSFSYKTWVDLAEATIASIIIFNRKRVGDAQNILKGDFERRERIKENSADPLYQNLSEEEKTVARQYSRMTVRGKKRSKVHVLLKTEYEKSVELLLSHREDAGIAETNNYVFALPSAVGQEALVNGYNILKKFAFSCGAKDPLHLNGTLLRKHLATHCASLGLDDSRVSDISDFMGHSELVHRQYYRQNPVERQFVHVPLVLEDSRGNKTFSTSPDRTNPKKTTRDTNLEREGPSTSKPKRKRRRS